MKFFTLLLVLISRLVNSLPQGRITNGHRAAEYQFPYQVGISLGEEHDSPVYCGGSVISENWVLTAGHCVFGQKHLTLRFGSTNFSAPFLNHTVTRDDCTVHPDFNPVALFNDIALIKTPLLTRSPHIKPVELPPLPESYSKYVGERAIVAGWGKTTTANSDPFHLNWAILKIISNKKCARFYGQQSIIKSKMCVSTTIPVGTSTCHADSGGALVLEGTNKQIGISSFVPKHGCNFGFPAGFTRVTEYITWIKDVSGIAY